MMDIPDDYVHTFGSGEGFHYKVECVDCDWGVMMGLEKSVIHAKDGHERYNDGHACRVSELDTPLAVSDDYDGDEEESKEELARSLHDDGKSLKQISEHEDIDESVAWVREATNGGFDS